jgi:hypothetical protein
MAHGPRWPTSSTENELNYYRNADPTEAFFMEFCNFSRHKLVTKELFRDVCLRYTDESDLVSPNDKDIKRVMDNKGVGFYHDPVGIKPRKRWWRGIEIDASKVALAGWPELLPKIASGSKEFGITGSGEEITGSFEGKQIQSQASQGIQTNLGAIDTTNLGIECAVKENAVIGCDSCDSRPKRTQADINRENAEMRRRIMEGGGP